MVSALYYLSPGRGHQQQGQKGPRGNQHGYNYTVKGWRKGKKWMILLCRQHNTVTCKSVVLKVVENCDSRGLLPEMQQWEQVSHSITDWEFLYSSCPPQTWKNSAFYLFTWKVLSYCNMCETLHLLQFIDGYANILSYRQGFFFVSIYFLLLNRCKIMTQTYLMSK